MNHTEADSRPFGQAAEAYLSSPIHARGSDLAKLLEALRLQGTERVLDLATGMGHTAIALAPRAAHVVGLEVKPELLEHARRLAQDRGLANVEFLQGAAESIPFPDASFDLATCRIAAHHFADPDRVFGEVARVLVPGGRFVLIDHFAPDADELDRFINTLDKERDPSHVRAYRLHEWQAFFQRHGLRFEVADIWDAAHDFEYWVRQAGTPETTVVKLRRMLVEAPPTARKAFHITLSPDITFTHPRAMMVGTKESA